MHNSRRRRRRRTDRRARNFFLLTPDQHRAAQRVNVRAAEELIRDVAAISAGGGTHCRRTAAITSTAPRARAAARTSYAGTPDPPKSFIFGRLRGYS